MVNVTRETMRDDMGVRRHIYIPRHLRIPRACLENDDHEISGGFPTQSFVGRIV
ncbi:hypothetical protein BS47DRAFT_1352556 [Hydnum rufescens UP504]|uniref:Uncharacterized protein n=1 Tax=Hydnum rufescens UP504 TaxID=1448309 RepID=A0A9P6DPU0_9AGAM|nr:hypothetical protein BS47DRAFT_1352556 [Hydnum rufescens UP504]